MILGWFFTVVQVVAPPSGVTNPAQSSPPPAPSADAQPTEPAVEPYVGSLRAGRVELARLSLADDHDAARVLTQKLLAKPDWELTPELERAETLYAIGVARARAQEVSESVEAFHRARGLAGSTELGRDAAYNAGTHLLFGAEDIRLQIPEIRAKLGLPALPAPPQPLASTPGAPGSPAQPAEAPDTLKLAREAYGVARRELVEAWRAEPSFEDARANLELIQRRLRELAELEKKREEEQQKQDDQQKGDQQDQKQDPSESKPEDQKDESKPQDDAQQQPEDEQKQEEQKPEDSSEDKDKPPEEQNAQPKDAREEMLMTPEEMQRLLDQLERIDEQAEKVQAMLRERRRAPVKKDW